MRFEMEAHLDQLIGNIHEPIVSVSMEICHACDEFGDVTSHVFNDTCCSRMTGGVRN